MDREMPLKQKKHARSDKEEVKSGFFSIIEEQKNSLALKKKIPVLCHVCTYATLYGAALLRMEQ